MHDAQLLAPAAEIVPAIQRVQLVCPGEEKDPAAHVRQLEFLPCSAEAVPAEQGEQLDEPASETSNAPHINRITSGGAQ